MRLARTFPFTLFVIAALVLAASARAESVQWSDVQPDLYTFVPPAMHMWLEDAMVSVSYNVGVWEFDVSGAKMNPLASGASIPISTYVLFEFIPHQYTDIYWFGTGGGLDSPNGDWVADGATPDPLTRCHAKNYYDTSTMEGEDAPLRVYAALGVDLPDKALTVSTGDCTTVGGINKLCRFDEPATVSTQFTFNATNGLFWGGWRGVDFGYPGTNEEPRCFDIGVAANPFRLNEGPSQFSASNGVTAPSNDRAFPTSPTLQGYKVSVPTQTIPHTLTVTAPEHPEDPPEEHAPSTPSLSSGGACVIGSPHSINFVSTDPDGDNLRYGIDWDNAGGVDEWVPPTRHVASGQSQSASRTYSMTGSKTVKVMAQDEGGLASDWATLTFTCTETPQQPPAAGQCSDTTDNDNDGLIDSLDPECSATTGFSESSNTNQNNNNNNNNNGGTSAAVLELRVIPSLVRSGRTTKVNWSAQNVESCTVSAANGDTWTGSQSALGGQTSRPITAETTYSLSCVDFNGATKTRQATVRVLPSWRER